MCCCYTDLFAVVRQSPSQLTITKEGVVPLFCVASGHTVGTMSEA